ncbi:MAG: polymerase, partial [Treponema sp.]|nr:polymerase [Treponema sp.]
MRKAVVGLGALLAFAAVSAFGQAQVGISGAVEWDKMEINAAVSLDLALAQLKLPSGRMQGEALISSEYIRLISPNIMGLQVDSSSVIGDLVGRGEWSLQDVENLALQARSVPPALPQD